MRVVCDNCGASYKIPDSKLTREVNKATCRKCGNPILIRRPESSGAAPAASMPAAEERTLITSAAELERQARARASSVYDEGAMDPRPTQVSPDNSHTEATVPRDDEAEQRAAGFRPMEAPSEAGTLVQVGQSQTLVPDSASSGLPIGGPAPAMQVPGPLPPPASPQRVAQAYGQGGASSHPSFGQPAAVAPAPPPPFGRQASLPPAPPPAASPPPPIVPVASALPPPSIAPAPAYSPTLAAPSVGAKSTHNPAGDLTFALLLSLLSIFGVLLGIANSWVGMAAVGGAGTFLALLGASGVALVVLTGGRGTRPASIVLSVAGGFVLAFVGGMAQALAGLDLSGSSRPEIELTAKAPAKAVEIAPPVAEVKPVEPAPDLAALAAVAEPAPPEAALTSTTPPVAAAPPVAAVVPAPAVVKTTPPPPAKTTTSSRTTTTASEPTRIAPKTTTTTTAPKTTSSSSGKSTGSSASSSRSSAPAEEPEEAPASKATSLDTRVISTMMNNNKGVKLCFIKQSKETGELPKGVKVKMTVQPSGSVSSAKISGGDWAGTDFDGCLSGAVKSIQFPPFDGDPLTLTYPFVL